MFIFNLQIYTFFFDSQSNNKIFSFFLIIILSQALGASLHYVSPTTAKQSFTLGAPTSLVSRSLRVASALLSLVSTPSLTFDTANLPAGTYFVTRSSPQDSSTQKLTID